MQYFRYFSLFILLSSVVYTNTTLAEPNVWVGIGEDGHYTEPCLSGDRLRTFTTSNAAIESFNTTSRDEISTQINASGNASIRVPFIKGDFQAKLDTFLQESNQESTFYLKSSSTIFSDIASNSTLSKLGQELTNSTNDPVLINAKCGHSFINRIDYGGELFLKLSIKIHDKYFNSHFFQRVSVKIRIFGKKISITVTVDKNISKRDLKFLLSFEGIQIGGDPSKLQEKLAILNAQKYSCNSNNSSSCSITLNGDQGPLSVFSYLTDFQRQISESNSVYRIYTDTYKNAGYKILSSGSKDQMSSSQKEEWKKLFSLKNEFKRLFSSQSEALQEDFYSISQKRLILVNKANTKNYLESVSKNYQLCDDGIENFKYCDLKLINKDFFTNKNTFLKNLDPQRNLFYYCVAILKNKDTGNEVDKLNVKKILSVFTKQFNNFSSLNDCQKLQDFLTISQNYGLNLSQLDLDNISILEFYPTIQSLDISFNPKLFNNTSEYFSTLNTLLQLKNLKSLDISGNEITDETPEEIDINGKLTPNPVFESKLSTLLEKLKDINLEFNLLSNSKFITDFISRKILQKETQSYSYSINSFKIAGNFFVISPEIIDALTLLFDPLEQGNSMEFGLTKLTLFGNNFKKISDKDIQKNILRNTYNYPLNQSSIEIIDSIFFCPSIEFFYKKKTNSNPDKINYNDVLKAWTGQVTEVVDTCEKLIDLKNEKYDEE